MEDPKTENPAAFPVLDPNGSFWNPGMSLRDYFANSAMQSLIIHYGNESSLKTLAETAYCISDHMLKERQNDL